MITRNKILSNSIPPLPPRMTVKNGVSICSTISINCCIPNPNPDAKAVCAETMEVVNNRENNALNDFFMFDKKIGSL